MSRLVNTLKNAFIKYSKRNLVTLKKDFVYDRYTYKEIYDYSLKFITFLKKNKIKKGDRIAICSYNCPQYFYVFIGCLFSGVVLVPIDFGSSQNLIKKFMKKTNCKLLINSKKKVIDTKKYYVEDLDYVLENTKKSKINNNIKEDELIQILFTSGTTGDPKGVLITHENIYSNLLPAIKVLKINKTYRLLSLLPLSHIFEQVAGFLGVAMVGARTVHLRSRRSSEIVKVMQKEKVNCIITVPAFFMLFKDRIEEKAHAGGNYDKLEKMLEIASKLPVKIRRLIFKKVHKVFGGHLTKVISGGASLPIETEQFWENIGVKVMKGYGLTETSPVLTLVSENDRKLGSVGKSIPGVRLKLSKENEILALGKNLTPGYYKNPEATSKLFDKGWLRTGDVGEFDNENHLYIRGRVKNMILKPSGLNVYPEDIEKIVDKQPEVKESCVIGVEVHNDVIITGVLMLNKKLSEKQIKQIIQKINEKLEFHQKIQDYVIWKKKDFPRTLTLKIKRRDVVKEVENKTHIHTKSKDELIHLLSELSHVDAKDIKKNSTLFSDLGFDSLKVIELSTLIEERLKVEIDESLIDSKTTVSILRDLIKKGKDASKEPKLNSKIFWQIFKPLKIIWPELAFLFVSRFITELKVTGTDNLKKHDQVIIVSNHTSHFDAPVLTKHLPIKIRTKLATGGAADYFFKKESIKDKLVASFFYYVLGGFPMVRDEKESDISLKTSFGYVGEIIDKGWSLGLAPEGTRSRTGKMNPFKNGIGIIVKEVQLPVIPVKINGLFDIFPPGSRYPVKKGPVSLKFGKPIYFDHDLTPIEITKQLENIIKKM